MPTFKNSLEVLKRIKDECVNSETETFDYKRVFKFSNTRDKLEIIKDIVAFANGEGGYIVFGVTDKYCEWVGLDDESDLNCFSDITINNFLSNYVDSPVGFQTGLYELDNETFGLLTVDKNEGELIPFIKDGEYERTRPGKDKPIKGHVFRSGDIYGRIKSSSTRVNDDIGYLKLRQCHNKVISNLDKIPRPYRTFVERPDDLKELLDYLDNPNIRSAQINGLGGIGKTSFVRNVCDKICDGIIKFQNPTKYIIWITGKLDSFSPSGSIETIKESALCFDEMIDTFVDVLSIDSFGKNNDELGTEILDKLANYDSLIVFDNMETITDTAILKFTEKIPLNCKIIFTTRTNMSVTYKRIDMNGFDSQQFKKYVECCVDDFGTRNKKTILNTIESFIDDLLELVQGSPILTSMIVYKICNGGDTSTIVDELRHMKKNNSYYDAVMDFCFKNTFISFNLLSKKILFVMSISDINGEVFSISDLAFILNTDSSDINEAMMKLFAASFCIQSNQDYICQPLVKIFVNKRITKDIKQEVLDKISRKYYEWSKKKVEIESYEDSLFNRAKAYNFERKSAFLRIRDLKQKYDAGFEYLSIKDEMQKLILEIPDYAYLYFSLAKLEQESDEDFNVIKGDYESAVKLDDKNDYYLDEYAYFLLDNKKYDLAIQHFKRAIEINDRPNYHFGLAVSLTRLYSDKPEFFTESNEILTHFEKCYFTEDKRINLFRNARNADAHARYLKRIKRFDEALSICEKGLLFSPNDQRLNSLKGSIMKEIDPNYVSDTMLKNVKRGAFSGISDEIAQKLLDICKEEDK